MESRRVRFEGTCETCRKPVRRGEVCFIDKRTGTDGWILWHLDCDAKSVGKAPRTRQKAPPRVWIDTRKFKLPWSPMEAL